MPFRPNWAQAELLDDLHTCNIVLKARQLGITTFFCIYLLDQVLWKDNVQAGIIAHTLQDSKNIFQDKLKFAFDNLPPGIKELFEPKGDSAQELSFAHGSVIRVGTSLRSSTLQYLLISEFGKICAKFPEKAKEIVTGALNTVHVGQFVAIESTAEGREGFFYDMCKEAHDSQLQKKELTPTDYRFFFFPWWKEPSYRIGSPLTMSEDMAEYFISLKAKGIPLTNEQQWWYAAKEKVQGEEVKREYPSTPDEAWEQSNEGTYYGKLITIARLDNRIGHVPYDDALPVYTAWDLGYNDSTAIWFFQVLGKEIRLIDYVEGSGESLTHWLNLVKRKDYTYEKHLAPHDILAHEYTSGMTRQASARKLGISLIAVPKVQIIQGIDAGRHILNRCWFDETKCMQGIKALENYKKEWNDRLGCWSQHPLHDWSSHGADAFRTLATGMCFIRPDEKLIKDREHLESLRDESGLLPGSFLYTPNNPSSGSHYRSPFG